MPRAARPSCSTPANRVSVRHPSGFVGPAFDVRGLLVWGFTAGLLSRLFALVGWERPWDRRRSSATLPESLVNVVDVVLVAVAVLAAWPGWRQGLISGVLSFVGFIGGALVGALLAPRLLGDVNGLFAFALGARHRHRRRGDRQRARVAARRVDPRRT